MISNLLKLVFFAMLASHALAATQPYDESVDAKAQVQQALAVAQSEQLPVLVIFGANWCSDCRALDKSLKTTKSAELISKAFVVVKVDVGNFNRNLDLVAVYGEPIKNGIPAAVILSPNNSVLYTTRAGELANARRMSDSGIYDFFRNVSAGLPSVK